MISIVIGKPGSGKTYHMVRYLFDMLCDLLKKSDNDRTIYTNISVNIQEFNRQLSEKFGQVIDVSSLLTVLDANELKFDPRLVAPEDRIEKRVAGKSFFSVAATSKAFFWNRFPDDALIMIDEIQKYLSTVKEESDSEKQSLIEYFSLHRHRKHDWFFITQNLLSLPVEVRRVSERVYDVFNAKSMSIGFPVNIPLRDIETLLAGFGVQRQVYRDSVEVVVMEKRVFALYQTHTQLMENSAAAVFKGDSALPFDLGPGQQWRALAWFFRKHGFHLGVKLILVCWFFGGIFVFLYHHSAGYLAKQKELAENSNVKNELSSGEVQLSKPADGASVDDTIYDDELNQSITFPPIVCDIIYNRVLLHDGKEYRVGDVLNNKRISDINSRDGVTYEPLENIYDRDFLFLRDSLCWLQECRTSPQGLEVDSSGSN